MATTMTATVQEAGQSAGVTLLLSRDEAARLGLAAGQTVTLEVKPANLVEPWEGIVVSERDFEAMKREIKELVDRGVDSGVSPTLERLVAEAEAQGHVARKYRD